MTICHVGRLAGPGERVLKKTGLGDITHCGQPAIATYIKKDRQRFWDGGMVLPTCEEHKQTHEEWVEIDFSDISLREAIFGKEG